MSFQHKKYLMMDEKSRLAGEHRQAVDLSNESAGENGFIQEEALANDPCHGKRPDGRAS